MAKVRVFEPTKNLDGVVFYNVIYFIGDDELKVARRYSDFEALREAWKRILPGFYLPFLPSKKIFGNTD